MPGRRRRSGAHARRAAGAAAVVAALALAGCAGGDEDAIPKPVPVEKGGTLNFGADQEPTGFNVNTSKDSGTAARSVTIQVLPASFHATPQFEPVLNSNLLESAELTETDPQTVVYRIREEAVWSDGTPITAADYQYLWRSMNGTVADNDVATTAGYEDIESVTGANDGKTVTVVFAKRFADWQSLFNDILPAHVAKRLPGGWNDGFNDGIPVSGGPFEIASFTRGESLKLVRNNAWWGPTPNLDSIVFRFLPDSSTQPSALANGEVDLIYPQPQLDLVQQVQAQADVVSQISFGLQFEHLDFNFANPHLAQLPVRQAIAEAIDRNELVDRTVGQFHPGAARLDNRIWLPGQAEYVAHGREYAERDLAAATALLKQAGYAKDGDGVWARDGSRLSLRLSTTAGNALREQQATLLQQQLTEAGIEVEIVNAPSEELFGEHLPEGNFDLAVFGWVGTPYPVSSSADLYRAGGGGNYGRYNNPKVAELFDQATQTLDRRRLVELSHEIDQQLWVDMATLPLYQKPFFLAHRDTLGNVRENATTDTPFWNSYTWGWTAAAT
jgi:peptide/nickel transport system substrate-binding protein